MSVANSTQSATGIATPDTRNRTRIDWKSWNPPKGREYWPADFRIPEKREHYKHLDQMNGGLKNGPTWWNQKLFNAWSNRDLILNLCTQLELLPRQQYRAVSYFLGQDLRKWGIRKELVAWAVCAYSVHSDKRDMRRCHPQVQNGEKAERFWEVAYHLDLSMKDRVKTYHKAQNRMG